MRRRSRARTTGRGARDASDLHDKDGDRNIPWYIAKEQARRATCPRRVCGCATEAAAPTMWLRAPQPMSSRLPNRFRSPTDVRPSLYTPRRADARLRAAGEVGAVLAWIDRSATPLGSTLARVDEAAGRILASSVIAPLDVPAFDRAAMDGYALRGAETSGATEYNPLELRVLGQALPGQPFSGRSRRRRRSRIMTGAPVPRRRRRGRSGRIRDARAAGRDRDHAARRPGPARRPPRRGHPGRCDGPGSGPAAAPAGCRPRSPRWDSRRHAWSSSRACGILVTGNEVVRPGEPKGPHQIYDANSSMLRGLVARDGGRSKSHHRLGDDPDKIRAALLAPGADVILVSGGSSVGSEDHAPRLLAEAGELAIHGVAMRPSSPAGCRPHRRGACFPAARQSGVLSVRVRFLRRPRHPAARRTRRPTGRTARGRRRRAQDRFRHRPRRLLPRAPRRRPGRAASRSAARRSFPRRRGPMAS